MIRADGTGYLVLDTNLTEGIDDMTVVWSRGESKRRALRRAVESCLTELGDSPLGVAARLESYGVRGVPGRADDCPMARYLRAVIGSERTVGRIGVLEQRLRVNRRGLHLPFSVPLPAAIQAFVRSFDEGQYPRLTIAADRPNPAKPLSHPEAGPAIP